MRRSRLQPGTQELHQWRKVASIGLPSAQRRGAVYCRFRSRFGWRVPKCGDAVCDSGRRWRGVSDPRQERGDENRVGVVVAATGQGVRVGAHGSDAMPSSSGREHRLQFGADCMNSHCQRVQRAMPICLVGRSSTCPQGHAHMPLGAFRISSSRVPSRLLRLVLSTAFVPNGPCPPPAGAATAAPRARYSRCYC